MIKAVIFDMDGLIVDSEPIESESLEILLKHYGKIPIYNKEGLIHTVGVCDGYENLREKYKIDDSVEIIRRKKRKIHIGLLARKFKPKQGFVELVDLLKKHSIKTGLASNRRRSVIKIIINNMGVAKMFDCIIGPSKKIRHKPKPDIYLTVARRLKVDTAECVVLEDSETGVIAGKAAGMKAIAVPNKYTKSHDFSKANLIVNSLSDIKWSTILSI